MTGAPKLRAVQILDALEQRDRGIYSGSIGYICASGTVDQSVVIRTIVKAGEKLELSAGGASTWLSEEEKEWDEVMTKANAVASWCVRDWSLKKNEADQCELERLQWDFTLVELRHVMKLATPGK